MVRSDEKGEIRKVKNAKGPLRMHTGLWKTVVAMALLNLPVLA
jgi:hypothetical protein